MGFLIAVGVLYCIGMLFLFFAGPAIRRALHHEVHILKDRGTRWLKDPDYYKKR